MEDGDLDKTRLLMKAPELKFMKSPVFVSRLGLWFRLLNMACAIFVSFYLLFDVLDLDGSQYAPTPAGKSPPFMDEKVTDIKPIFSSTLGELKIGSFSEVPSSRDALASLLLARALRFSGLKASRRYRIGLPRSSVTDSSLPFRA